MFEFFGDCVVICFWGVDGVVGLFELCDVCCYVVVVVC